ncbi:protein of unknown function [Taphrina deformans PYCC 5710]|uniref:Phosphatidylinositol 3-kinase VPS34 n=1 Tax=Taphrina deformans (strain PYCC 5710 / ATCC 11124 / CBS 356.35 / IMI 108563 / JCM 9778 / NBRC 8474) TaxID=1097556 RepID=R4XEP4_TAPDE|nr:protein of unknown function [Taphrina deformans PYCC 5710]|eukprot:CCG84246.1 protein of unknown function [Taphrina deformans PYCC 5710]
MAQLTYSYLPSHQLKIPFDIKVNGLELTPSAAPLSSEIYANPSIAFIGANTKAAFEFYLTLELWSDNKNLWPQSQTRYRANNSAKVTWDEHLEFCDIQDLPRNSQLAITVWDLKGPGEKYAYAGTTVSLYDKEGVLKKGRQKLLLHKNKRADPDMETSTPAASTETTELDRLEELMKAHSAGEMPKSEWLDNLAFRQIEKIAKAAAPGQHDFLIVEFPRFQFPVLYTCAETSYTINPDTVIHHNTLVMVYDPDTGKPNPADLKHRQLIRSKRNATLDKYGKPSPKVRDHLRDLIAAPTSYELSNEDKNDLWHWRYHLMNLPGTLPKFLRSVVWSDAQEAAQAVSLLHRWYVISVDSALELLGPYFTNPEVREFAVARLTKAEDIEIMLYLLQLVQALRYEPDPSTLCEFLINKARENDRLGTQFFWYLTVESSDPKPPAIFGSTKDKFLKAVDTAQRKSLMRQAQWVQELIKLAEGIKANKDNRLRKIESFRSWASERRAMHDRIPFPLDPTLEVTGYTPDRCSVFKSSLFPLRLALITTPARASSAAHHAKESSGGAEIEQREAAMAPIEPGTFDVIFKSGDDLRQDQLVIQIITLFNDLLLRERLDLKLTPYRILATGPTSGFVEFIASAPLASVLSEYGSLAPYLGATSTRKVSEAVMDTYVRSCAGYCVITYLLGVGDRHLDNLLLTKSGHFFHADFGFILGRDPKPFAPALKLVREMVDVMNVSSPAQDGGYWYTRFRSYCFTAFSALRKNSSLVLNLFSLMVDANIPDIRIEPTRAVEKITERFCLEMDEEQSLRFFEDLLIESVSALFPVLIDRVHNIAQYLRA